MQIDYFYDDMMIYCIYEINGKNLFCISNPIIR